MSLFLLTPYKPPSVPLSIEDDPTGSHIQSLLAPCNQRIRRLDVVITNRPFEDSFWDASHVPWLRSLDAPQLECLNVWFPACLSGDMDEEFEYIPLFCGSMERHNNLKALSISGMSHWLPKNSFPVLTHLCLSFEGCYGTVNYQSLLSVFANTPCLMYSHLAYLDYDDMFMTDDEEFDPWPTPIPLPQLRLFAFSHCRGMPEFLRLVPRLVLPTHALVRIESSELLSLSRGRRNSALFTIPASEHATELHVHAAERAFTLALKTALPEHGGFWMDAVAPSDWVVKTGQAWNYFLKDALSELSTTPAPANLTACLFAVRGMNAVALGQFLQLTEHLERLEISIQASDEPASSDWALNALRTLCAALMPTRTDDHLAAFDIHKCPLLHTLRISVCVAWSDLEDSLAEITDILSYTLAARHRAGHALHLVAIQPLYTRPPSQEDHRVNGALSSLSSIGMHVGKFEIVGPEREFFRKFEAGQLWTAAAEDEQAYWGLEDL